MLTKIRTALIVLAAALSVAGTAAIPAQARKKIQGQTARSCLLKAYDEGVEIEQVLADGGTYTATAGPSISGGPPHHVKYSCSDGEICYEDYVYTQDQGDVLVGGGCYTSVAETSNPTLGTVATVGAIRGSAQESGSTVPPLQSSTVLPRPLSAY